MRIAVLMVALCLAGCIDGGVAQDPQEVTPVVPMSAWGPAYNETVSHSGPFPMPTCISAVASVCLFLGPDGSEFVRRLASNETLTGLDLELQYTGLDPTAWVELVVRCREPDGRRACAGGVMARAEGVPPLRLTVDDLQVPSDMDVVITAIRHGAVPPFESAVDFFGAFDFELQGQLVLRNLDSVSTN